MRGRGVGVRVAASRFRRGCARCPHADDIDAKRSVLGGDNFVRSFKSSFIHDSYLAAAACLGISLTPQLSIDLSPCTPPFHCCAHALAHLHLEQPGFALLNTFLPPQSASYTRRERRTSHVPRSFSPERDFLPRHALNPVQLHRRKATHRLRHQNRDSTVTKCLPTSSHLHARCARLARHTDCRSKGTTRELS